MKHLYQLKNEYFEIKIPDELEAVVKNTILRAEKKMMRSKKLFTFATAAAAVVLVFIGTVNVSPAAAKAMSNIPVIKNLVKVVTFREYSYIDDKHELDIKVPQIDGLENKELENALNANYLEKNAALYDDFMKKIGTEGELNEQYFSIYTDYNIKTDTDKLLVVENIKDEILASGYQTVQYDTIDRINELVLTLPSLFKDNSYVDIISNNIKSQMEKQMKADQDISYFLGEDEINGFVSIQENQNFYINAEGKLVISFNEYEVAPGSMGIVEFVIPTEVIKDQLVSDYYIN